MADINGDPATIVLVAEDETIVRLTANDLLTDAGYRVLEARDGQEALTILEIHPDIRAVFTDVNMPNLDGSTLARIVRERWPQIAIVITSALPPSSEPPHRIRFVRKPYKAGVVLRALEETMAETKSETGAAPIALMNIPNLRAGLMHGAGGLAQPLPEPEE